MSDTITKLSLVDGYTDIQSILESLPNDGDDYDYVLLHCYAHIKNEEIFLEIDKDIYEHVVIYEGHHFLDAVRQYFFTLKIGAILAYKKGSYPNLRMTDFVDSYDDFATFQKEVESLAVKTKPIFYLLTDGKESNLHNL